ncbi:MAG TPA: hypothetical protein VGN42_08620 [Pirellulales bacterium]|jgi:hypothetical protein|nr:hypothetical protein [Pirellulales bacterium]
MEVSYAFFARAAEQSPDGTLHVFGADFDTLQVDAFPALTPFNLVVKFVCRQFERGETRRIAIDLTRPKGARSQVAEKQIVLGAGVAEHDQDFGASLVVLIGMLFEAAGSYSFHVLVDGVEMKMLRLRVLPTSAAPIATDVAERQNA